MATNSTPTTLADVIRDLHRVTKPFLDHRGVVYINLPLDPDGDGPERAERIRLDSRQGQAFIRRKLFPVYPTRAVPEGDIRHVAEVLEGFAVTAPRRKTPVVPVTHDESYHPLMEVLAAIARNGGIKTTAERILVRVRNVAETLLIPASKLPADKQEIGNMLGVLAKGGMKPQGVTISYDPKVKPREWHVRLTRPDHPEQGQTHTTSGTGSHPADTAATSETPPPTPPAHASVANATTDAEVVSDDLDTTTDLTVAERDQIARVEQQVNAEMQGVKA